MTLTRRELLKNGLGALGFCYSVNQMLDIAAQASELSPRSVGKSRIIVAIQLAGGNDGLNMVVPYGNGSYYQARKSIAIPVDKVMKLNDQIGLNPAMSGMHNLYQTGKLAILQGVGYPDPNRSHFRSIEIWQTARPDKIEDTGWLGRYLDLLYSGRDNLFPAVNVDPLLPKTLFGAKVNVPSVSNINDFRFRTDPHYAKDRSAQVSAFNDIYADYALNRPNVELLRKAGVDANRASDHLRDLVSKYRSSAAYPDGGFGKSMKFIAQMITGKLDCSVYGASLNGFDTHSNQTVQQDRLLKELSDGLAAFYSDLEAHNVHDEVLVLVFSEFGRRVAENGARGTDHGTAAPMFVLGSGVKGGIYGEHPDFGNLDNGDLKYKIDFRNVYATILDRWMKADSREILFHKFDDLGFIV